MSPKHADYTKEIQDLGMYSYENPAWVFWNAAMNSLIKTHGLTKEQALEWLDSKHARWMLDQLEQAIENTAEAMVTTYVQSNKRALQVTYGNY